MNTSNLKIIVRGAYDLQKLRIQMGNRICANFKAKLGQEPGENEETLSDDSQKLLDELRREYKKLTDGLKTFPRLANFKGTAVISDYTELCLVSQYVELEDRENRAFLNLGNILKTYPLYRDFLEPIKGLGPQMAGIIISEIDIHKARYVSSLWKYAGLDCAEDGAGRSRRAEHLVMYEYITKDGEVKERKGITFNPLLKTKLVGVLASCLIKANNSIYRDVYDGYKHRLEQHPGHQEKTKGHRDNMAKRYMIKIFLQDLYVAWRTIEGLPVAVPYCEAKLGYKHAA